MATYAGEVVARREGAEIAGGEDAEVRVGLAPLGLLEVVPPEVDALGDEAARDVLPVLARVLGARHRLVDGLARDRPPGLGHPDGLVPGEGDGLVEAVVEARVRVPDAVRLRLLPVGVPVEAEPGDVVDDGAVRVVEEGVVRVDVADRAVGERRARDGAAHLVDAVDELRRRQAHLVVGVAVEVLAADGDAHHEVRERRSVLADGRLKSGDLVGDGLVAARHP